MSLEQKQYHTAGRRLGWAEAIAVAESKWNALLDNPVITSEACGGAYVLRLALNLAFVAEFPGVDLYELLKEVA